LKKFVGANINFLFLTAKEIALARKMFEDRFAKMELGFTFAPAFEKHGAITRLVRVSRFFIGKAGRAECRQLV